MEIWQKWGSYAWAERHYCWREKSSFKLRPNPKSLTGGLSQLWHRIKVDSDIGLPMVNAKCVWVDSEVDIRWGFSQLRHRVSNTMFFSGFGLLFVWNLSPHATHWLATRWSGAAAHWSNQSLFATIRSPCFNVYGAQESIPRNEPVFLNVYGAPESIPRNEFRQPMWPGGPVR